MSLLLKPAGVVEGWPPKTGLAVAELRRLGEGTVQDVIRQHEKQAKDEPQNH